MFNPLFAADDKINLAEGWDKVYTPIRDALGPNILNLLTAVGVIVVVAAIGKWMWDKRRGGGMGGGGRGMTDQIGWSLLLGATLSAPALIIPIFLKILDAVANGIAGIFNGV